MFKDFLLGVEFPADAVYAGRNAALLYASLVVGGFCIYCNLMTDQ